MTGWIILKNNISHNVSSRNLIFWQEIHDSRLDPSDDSEGGDSGQGIAALYKSAPLAAKKDAMLYQSMALVDAIRLGNAREVAIARDALKKRLRE